MFKGPLEDRIAIRELHETFADAVVRASAEDWGAVWTENGSWELMGTAVEGRKAIVTFWSQAMSGFEAVSFNCMPSAIIIKGNRATGRCQVKEYLKLKDGATRAVGGLYEDEMVKINSRWLYAKRVYRIVVEYQPKEV